MKLKRFVKNKYKVFIALILSISILAFPVFAVEESEQYVFQIGKYDLFPENVYPEFLATVEYTLDYASGDPTEEFPRVYDTITPYQSEMWWNVTGALPEPYADFGHYYDAIKFYSKILSDFEWNRVKNDNQLGTWYPDYPDTSSSIDVWDYALSSFGISVDEFPISNFDIGDELLYSFEIVVDAKDTCFQFTDIAFTFTLEREDLPGYYEYYTLSPYYEDIKYWGSEVDGDLNSDFMTIRFRGGTGFGEEWIFSHDYNIVNLTISFSRNLVPRPIDESLDWSDWEKYQKRNYVLFYLDAFQISVLTSSDNVVAEGIHTIDKSMWEMWEYEYFNPPAEIPNFEIEGDVWENIDSGLADYVPIVDRGINSLFEKQNSFYAFSNMLEFAFDELPFVKHFLYIAIPIGAFALLVNVGVAYYNKRKGK